MKYCYAKSGKLVGFFLSKDGLIARIFDEGFIGYCKYDKLFNMEGEVIGWIEENNVYDTEGKLMYFFRDFGSLKN